MFSNIFGGRTFDPRRIGTQAFPLFIQPPHERRHPGESTLDQSHSQSWKAVENAFGNDADDLRLEDLGHPGMFLQIGRGPSYGCWRVAGRAAKVDTDNQVVLDRGGIERVVEAVAVGNEGAHRQDQLYKLGMIAEALDLCGGACRRLAGQDQRGAQTGFGREPFVDLPAVCGRSQVGGEIVLFDALDTVGAVEDADLGVPGRERLVADKLEVGTGCASLWRPASRPGRGRRAGRIVGGKWTLEGGVADIVLPVVGEVGKQLFDGGEFIVDVAVYDRARRRMSLLSIQIFGFGL